jgi:hypothetical protein
MRWFYVVEHEGLPYVGFGFGLLEFGDFGDDLVALVVAVRAKGGDSGQLREELDEAAMAREERLVDGGDHVFCRRFPPVALAVMVVAFPTVFDGLHWGPLGDLYHFLGSSSQRERVRGLILVGVAGATPWPNGGPWGWSGHPKSHIINKTKYYYIILIFIYFKNNKYIFFLIMGHVAK